MKARWFFILVIGLLMIGTVSADWLTGWDYRQKLHINGSASGDLTDYQVNLSVFNTTGSSSGSAVYIGDKAADDIYFSDLRITTSDGTTLCSIWNETQRVDGWDIWVKVPSIPVSGTDVYVYYGGVATPMWEGYRTFPLLYDHFSGTSLNTTTWIFAGSPTIYNSFIYVNSSTELEYIRFVNLFPINTTIRLFAQFSPPTEIGSMGYDSGSVAIKFMTSYRDANNYNLYSSTSGSNRTNVNIGNTYISYYTWDIIRNTTTNAIYKINNTQVGIINTNLPTNSLSGYFGNNGGSAGGRGNVTIDYIFIHSYNYPEPQPSTWTAEELAPCTAAFSGTPLSGSPPLTVQFTDESTTEAGTITWLWDFGDESPQSSLQDPAHTYTTTGTYTVKLYVENSVGSNDWENKTAYITVGNITPTPTPTPTQIEAAFSASPLVGPAPLTVQFTDQSTGSPTDWLWTFDYSNPMSDTSSDQNPEYTYTLTGWYAVNLSVWNVNSSDWELKPHYIHVTDPSEYSGENGATDIGETWILWNWVYPGAVTALVDGDEVVTNTTLGYLRSTGLNAMEVHRLTLYDGTNGTLIGEYEAKTLPSTLLLLIVLGISVFFAILTLLLRDVYRVLPCATVCFLSAAFLTQISIGHLWGYAILGILIGGFAAVMGILILIDWRNNDEE